MIAAVDKLKQLIIKRFIGYLSKLKRGYPLDKKEYNVIIEAMRSVNDLENFEFPEYKKDAIISYHILKLRTT